MPDAAGEALGSCSQRPGPLRLAPWRGTPPTPAQLPSAAPVSVHAGGPLHLHLALPCPSLVLAPESPPSSLPLPGCASFTVAASWLFSSVLFSSALVHLLLCWAQLGPCCPLACAVTGPWCGSPPCFCFVSRGPACPVCPLPLHAAASGSGLRRLCRVLHHTAPASAGRCEGGSRGPPFIPLPFPDSSECCSHPAPASCLSGRTDVWLLIGTGHLCRCPEALVSKRCSWLYLALLLHHPSSLSKNQLPKQRVYLPSLSTPLAPGSWHPLRNAALSPAPPPHKPTATA